MEVSSIMILVGKNVTSPSCKYSLKNVTDFSERQLTRMVTLLSTKEKQKYLRQRSSKRRKMLVLARFLLKKIVAKTFTTKIKLAQLEILNAHGSTGKPAVYYKGHKLKLELSISYAYPLVVVAVSNNNLGIDLEMPFSNCVQISALLNYCFTKRELIHLHRQPMTKTYFLENYWCLKECVGKLLGRGLSYNPKTIEVFIEGNTFFVVVKQKESMKRYLKVYVEQCATYCLWIVEECQGE